ncbi:CobD/CbiB family cobalamin biosynthesis protein, partial [Paracidovorax avenae]|uniref:CobD/CbiB family cobalamin biosynthesis protein n=1 Tax=Paracidovorax avenae TaxID=80867 RepID=UPI003F53A7CB
MLALLLKPLLAWRMLRDEVVAVEDALAQSLEAGRERLSRLVSRDVHALQAVQVRESAIESLAENLNDSVVAPLFWFALLGLPGAALYRFANTADAMWGYPGMRGGRYWQWAGKWAARADDVLSWVPARITAVLLALCARRVRWAAVSRQARRT